MRKSSARRVLTRIGVGVCILALLAWSPWLTPATTGWLARLQFNASWSFVMDGCGAHIPPAGGSFEKVPFGARTTLEYRCGLVMPDEPYQQARVFVSFLGTAHGYPSPWHSERPSGEATPIPAVRITP